MARKTKSAVKPVKNSELEKYFSSAKHELRNILTIVQEGTSQVLDGVGNKDCQRCRKILNPVLKNIKELDILIEQLLNTSWFESMLEKHKSNTKITNDDLEVFKKELIGVISHVVRTPLTVIKEGLALILDEIPGSLNPKQKEIVSKVKDNADRLVDYIEIIFRSTWDDALKTIGSKVYYKSIIKNNKH